ncbi:MAG: iron-containing redox enzyme family protein [Polyangiaceae bacterium]|nr:iron-containing redox enzyme family protein [Polyangiaceae bacterium]
MMNPLPQELPPSSLDVVRDLARRIFRDRPVEQTPLLASFAASLVSRPQALRVAYEMHAVVEAFPRFLAALLANDLDPVLRSIVVDNLYEEQGRMHDAAVHLTTYRALLVELGHRGPPSAIPRPSTGVVAYVRSMLDLCGRGPVAEAAAALAVVEDHVARASYVIGRWVAGELPEAPDRHFRVHETLDLRHADELYALAAHYWDAGLSRDVEHGIAMGSYLHRRLWADVFETAFAGAVE